MDCRNNPQLPDTGVGASLWWSLSAAPLTFAAGYFISPGLLFTDFVLLSISIFVGVLLANHKGRIPLTGIRLAARHIVVFWSILNLGVIAGALVALAAAFSRFSAFQGRRRDWIKSSAADVLCALAGGSAYAVVLGGSLSTIDLPVGALVSNEMLAASGAMLATYQMVWSILSATFKRNDRSRFAIVDHLNLAGHVVAVVAAIVMFAAFRHFGNAFGLVIVPLAVLGNVAYQIHLRRLAQKTKEIVDASRLHLATVEALATAIDARDQVGVGHVRRTQIYAVGIGNALGLSEGDLNAIRAGALLHDIGKLAVPEHILNKPGRLTSAELEKTKIHAVVGASILEKVGFPYPVVPTVRHHHEFWDGSGYPDGLVGDRIPITARILSVADAYDALRGTRPYRSAVEREDACNFLRSRAGTQFDPHVVNAFLRHLKELESEVEIHGFGYEADTSHPDQTADASEASYVEQIKRANQEVFSLYELARDFGSSLDLEETLSLLTGKVKEFVPYDTCLVYLMDDDNVHATATHIEGRNSELLGGKRIAVGEGASGYVLKKRKPVENVDPSLDFAFSHPDICQHYVGMACVPLLAEERLVGAISVFSGKLAVYEEEHLRLLETISRIAADAICKSIRNAANESYALTDQLTGLPNARSLQIQFEKEVGRAKRAGNSMQLLMLDLDGFKGVNDTFGHKAGDAMLWEVGRIIKAELRDYDFLARYGGDEFVAIVPETDNSDVIELCARIETAVESYASTFTGVGTPVGVSVGSASYPAQGETFEDLLIAADKAMYRTKAFHKQRLVRLEETAQNWDVERSTDQRTVRAEDSAVVSILDDMPIDTGLVVELDESHILTVSTIN